MPGRAGVRFWLVWGLNVLHLSEGENILGRDPEVGIWLGDPSVSRRHARILVKGETAELEDLGSKNGTYSGTDRIKGCIPLRDGDELRAGSVELVFHAASGAVSTRTAP